MGWHYIAVKHKHGDEVSYELHECFPDLGEDVYTQDPVNVSGKSPEDLAKWLRMAAHDVEKYEPIGE